jgi:hypothetical protein
MVDAMFEGPTSEHTTFDITAEYVETMLAKAHFGEA